MNTVGIFILFAVLVEAIWETMKMVWQDNKFNLNQIGTLVLGIGLAVLAQIDLTATFEMGLPAIVGQIITGVVLSRGSNYLYDLIGKLGGKGVQDGN